MLITTFKQTNDLLDPTHNPFIFTSPPTLEHLRASSRTRSSSTGSQHALRRRDGGGHHPALAVPAGYASPGSPAGGRAAGHRHLPHLPGAAHHPLHPASRLVALARGCSGFALGAGAGLPELHHSLLHLADDGLFSNRSSSGYFKCFEPSLWVPIVSRISSRILAIGCCVSLRNGSRGIVFDLGHCGKENILDHQSYFYKYPCDTDVLFSAMSKVRIQCLCSCRAKKHSSQ